MIVKAREDKFWTPYDPETDRKTGSTINITKGDLFIVEDRYYSESTYNKEYPYYRHLKSGMFFPIKGAFWFKVVNK